jgi:uncharacterized protein (DUF305 family)
MWHKTRVSRIFSTPVLATAILLGVTAGCSGSGEGSAAGQEGASATPTPGSDAGGLTVIQPGRPGEEASTGTPGEPVEQPPPNHSDIAFMQMMVPHHAQALEMAKLARLHAVDPAVRRMAARIRAAQGPEILTMSAWLERQNVEVPQPDDDPREFDHAQHGHDGMMGMLSEAEMTALENARGARFDRLFLRAMIRHHRGAVGMAETVSAEGADVLVSELAADVHVTQTSEIARMRQLLSQL